MNELCELPTNWAWAKIGDLVTISSGKSTKYISFDKVKQDNLPYDVVGAGGPIGYGDKANTCGPAIVLGRVGACGTTSMFTSEVWATDNTLVVKPKITEMGRVLELFFRTVEWAELTSGTSQPLITQKTVNALDFPLAPLAEQSRIAAKVQCLSLENKTVREALDKLPVLLRRFRQSVLDKAFRGELTQRDPNDEPAQKLLERIEQGPKKGRQDIIDEKERLKLTLPELPETWVWTTMSAVFQVTSGGTPRRNKPEYWNGSIPWVTSGEVAFGDVTETREHITEEGLENSSAKLCPLGTVLLALYGEGKTRGQVAILRIPATTNQAIACINCSEAKLPSEYLYWWLYYRYVETRRIGEGANQPNMYLHHVKAMPFPLAPISDQKRIVARITEIFSLIDIVEAKAKESKGKVDSIDQAILAKAFRGELVPQDPNDEPASVLLKRMKGDLAKPRVETTREKAKPDYQRKLQTEKQIKSLEEVLREMGAATIEQTFEASGLSMNEFWDKLKIETKAGRIEKSRKGNLILLRVKN